MSKSKSKVSRPVRFLSTTAYYGGWCLAGAWGLYLFGLAIGEVEAIDSTASAGAGPLVLETTVQVLLGLGAVIGLLAARFLRDSWKAQLGFLVAGAGAVVLGLSRGGSELQEALPGGGGDIGTLTQVLLGTISLAGAVFGLLLAGTQAFGMVARSGESRRAA